MLAKPKMKCSLATWSAVVGCLALPACGGAPDGSSSQDLSGTDVSLLQTESSSDRQAPVLPSPTLAVPDGNRLAFHYDAIGVQIYGCQANGAGYSWVFQAPEATLYGRHGRIEGKHYVGPTWESKDGSTVVGKKLAAFTADPTAIPELLLQAASYSGTGRMTAVTYVQRLDTVGGLAPASGCDATHVGEVARVDYTATYFFYEAKQTNDCDHEE